MRYRGLLEYYGKDLVAYKKGQHSDDARNEFLHGFSAYMADFLEDDCPPSWKNVTRNLGKNLLLLLFPILLQGLYLQIDDPKIF